MGWKRTEEWRADGIQRRGMVRSKKGGNSTRKKVRAASVGVVNESLPDLSVTKITAVIIRKFSNYSKGQVLHFLWLHGKVQWDRVVGGFMH